MSFGPPKLPDIKIPAAPVAPVAPATAPKDITKLQEEQKKKLTKGRIGRGTILTGPRGILTPPETSRKTLLGG